MESMVGTKDLQCAYFSEIYKIGLNVALSKQVSHFCPRLICFPQYMTHLQLREGFPIYLLVTCWVAIGLSPGKFHRYPIL